MKVKYAIKFPRAKRVLKLHFKTVHKLKSSSVTFTSRVLLPPAFDSVIKQGGKVGFSN